MDKDQAIQQLVIDQANLIALLSERLVDVKLQAKILAKRLAQRDRGEPAVKTCFSMTDKELKEEMARLASLAPVQTQVPKVSPAADSILEITSEHKTSEEGNLQEEPEKTIEKRHSDGEDSVPTKELVEPECSLEEMTSKLDEKLELATEKIANEKRASYMDEELKVMIEELEELGAKIAQSEQKSEVPVPAIATGNIVKQFTLSPCTLKQLNEGINRAVTKQDAKMNKKQFEDLRSQIVEYQNQIRGSRISESFKPNILSTLSDIEKYEELIQKLRQIPEIEENQAVIKSLLRLHASVNLYIMKITEISKVNPHKFFGTWKLETREKIKDYEGQIIDEERIEYDERFLNIETGSNDFEIRIGNWFCRLDGSLCEGENGGSLSGFCSSDTFMTIRNYKAKIGYESGFEETKEYRLQDGMLVLKRTKRFICQSYCPRPEKTESHYIKVPDM